ncbi:hypothetical protein DL95DRAFT_384361 [Leptodontidium sp. 2 PMI_412]|nr:hypothetical protein DL95DRAFT_384361 [Leptodontidium sp. 2 PMI_412]
MKTPVLLLPSLFLRSPPIAYPQSQISVNQPKTRYTQTILLSLTGTTSNSIKPKMSNPYDTETTFVNEHWSTDPFQRVGRPILQQRRKSERGR